jgi:protein-disulfide isomerase
MKRDFWISAATAVSCICAVVLTAVVVRREFFPRQTPTRGPRIETVADWKQHHAAGQRLGPADALVTIVEFSDFQCPFCARIQPTLEALRRDANGQVAVLYRHFPIAALHPFARTAAAASECAARQGRFKEMHDELYANQKEIGKLRWTEFATRVGVPDTIRFRECIDNGDADARLREDSASAASLRLSGTPTFLINDILVQGAPPATVDSLVKDALLRAQSAPPAR